jgi:L-serine kinase (ATP) / ParB family transcriptional regulator, heme-responsive regulator
MRLMQTSAPPPELRIVPTTCLIPHEDHDSQRAQPLIAQLRTAAHFINPPVVAPLEDDEQYIVLDGANRSYAFLELEYPHILVQITSYQSGYVTLSTWHHIVSNWDADSLLRYWQAIDGLRIEEGDAPDMLARVLMRDGRSLTLSVNAADVRERNAILRRVVGAYQQNARLHRTAIHEPHQNWPLYPEAFALVSFLEYKPEDIMDAARHNAHLPPGISRHIIHGRALRVNYPFEALRDDDASLEEKNAALQNWLQNKLANRQVRYYAEATYQFDE